MKPEKTEHTSQSDLFRNELLYLIDWALFEKQDKNKLYSLHEPETVCISKGKKHKRYEFGCKVGVAVTNKKQFCR